MLFVKIKRDSIDYGWMIKLQTLTDVLEYGQFTASANANTAPPSRMFETLPVYVERNGEWFPCNASCEQYDAIEAKKWPGDYKPEFKQWPGGKHWYCKVGGRDMVIDGNQKWKTLDAAKRAHERWAGPKNEDKS